MRQWTWKYLLLLLLLLLGQRNLGLLVAREGAVARSVNVALRGIRDQHRIFVVREGTVAHSVNAARKKLHKGRKRTTTVPKMSSAKSPEPSCCFKVETVEAYIIFSRT